MKNKKIAIFHDLPAGGAKRALWEICRQLQKHNRLAVYTIIDRDKQELFSLKKLKLPIYRFGFSGKTANYKNSRERLCQDLQALLKQPGIEKAIAREIDIQGYDFVLVNHSRFTQAPYILRYLKTSSFYLCHEPPRAFYEADLGIPVNLPFYKSGYEFWLRKIKKSLDRKNTLQANFLLVNSQFSQKRIAQVYAKKAYVFPHGVDTDFYRPLVIKKSNQVLTVGNCEPQKNQQLLVESLAWLPKKTRPALVIIGNNHPDRINLEKLAFQKQVKLVFKARVSDKELRNLYNQSLLTLASSSNEPLGLFVLESQACQTPVVAVNQGGFRETVIHGQTGFLVKSQALDFAAKIKYLLTNKKTRILMGKKGRNYVVSNWQWKKAVDFFDKFL